ncbi:MAG: hypothetical protein WCT05_08520 [Lentisphaeria bacterium]
MSYQRNLKNINFDGTFNEEVRQRIQIKRLQLGLAYQRVAGLFNANWSTIRKWEVGPTTTCSVALRPKVEAFLNGKFDKELTNQQKDPLTGSYPPSLPERVHQCMEKFGNAYQILRFRPDLREALLNNVDKITREILHTLVDSENQE